MTRADLEHGTIPGALAAAARRWPGALAIADGGTRLSFRDLEARVEEATRALVGLGLSPGDRAAIWAPNSWEWVVAAVAIQAAGGVLVPINTRFRGDEAAHVLQRSRARVLFTVRGFLGTDYPALLAGHALPDLAHTVILRGPGDLDLPAFLGHGAGIAPPGDRSGELCDLLFTSGTTGRPKGVPGTHAQTLRAFGDWAEIAGLEAGDRYLVVAPFFHSFGYKAGWLACLLRGATIVPEPVFDAGAVMARVAREAITVLPGPPSLYQSMLAHPERRALRSLRLAVTGAACIPVSLVHRMRDELGFQVVLTAYGLTEATGVSTMCRRDDDAETIATTSGRAIPGVEVRVAAPPGEPGEVLVRGYSVMRGYLDDPEATRATIDPDGWLHTGDVGVLDRRGYLRITDRLKDMFIVGGFNAYPAEIEAVIARHEGVAQAAVVGAPDERLGEVGVAFVVPKPGATIDADGLVRFCREHLANYKVPRRVEVVDALPMNASGKIEKHVLRARAR